jgi:hypothetical protein
MLKELSDKELDFNGQLVKSWVLREPDMRTADLVMSSIEAVKANLVVVSMCKDGIFHNYWYEWSVDFFVGFVDEACCFMQSNLGDITNRSAEYAYGLGFCVSVGSRTNLRSLFVAKIT